MLKKYFKFSKKDIYFIGFLIIFIITFNTINYYIDTYSSKYTYIRLPDTIDKRGIIYKKLDKNTTLILYYTKDLNNSIFIDYSNLHPAKITYSILKNNKLLFKGDNIIDYSKIFKIYLDLDTKQKKNLRINNGK